MPWSGDPGAGFTTGRPWMRIGPDAAVRNVAAQASDPDSVLACYRRLLAARRSVAALRIGRLRRLSTGDPDLLAWQRGDGPDAAVVVVNFATSERRVRWGRNGGAGDGVRRRTLVGTRAEPARPGAGGELVLRGLEGVVLVAA
jgi:glycosidase